MNRVARYRLIVAVLITVNLVTGGIWYIRSQAGVSIQRIAFMERQLMYRLRCVVDWEHLDSRPVHHYMALATAKALATLNGKDSLERPLVVYCLLYQDTGYGHVCLMLDYLEEGFESAGIEISYHDGEEARFAKLPFPAGAFESKKDREYITTVDPLIAFPARATIASDGIEIETAFRGAEAQSFTLPFSILEEPAYISVYTKVGQKSHPAKLLITKDLRAHIQSIRAPRDAASSDAKAPETQLLVD